MNNIFNFWYLHSGKAFYEVWNIYIILVKFWSLTYIQVHITATPEKGFDEWQIDIDIKIAIITELCTKFVCYLVLDAEAQSFKENNKITMGSPNTNRKRLELWTNDTSWNAKLIKQYRQIQDKNK